MNNLYSNSLLTKKDTPSYLNDFLKELKNYFNLKEPLQSRTSFSHKVLITCAQKLGYPAMSDGMCNGFTMRWIEAVLSNTTLFFYNRTTAITILNSLLNSTNDPDILEKIKTIPGFLDIKAFYDSAMLYQDSVLSSKILNKPLFFQNNEEISVFASSDLIRRVGGFKQTKPIVYNNFTLPEVEATLEELEGKIKDSGYKPPVVFLMRFINRKYEMHAASIIYIPVQQTWFFMDVNYFPPKAAAKLDTFVNQLPYSYYQDFSLTAILPHQNTESLLAGIGQICPIKPNLKNKSHILHLMTSHNHFDEVVEKLIKDTIFLPNEETPLFLAAQHGHLEIIQALLFKDGIDINRSNDQGLSPLSIASQCGHLEVVEALLLKDGIDINRPNDKGLTALSIASQKGHLEIVQALLLKDGININRPCDQDATPLFMASQCGHLEIVQALLLKDGIDINRPITKGYTPLSIASQNGHLEIVQTLLLKDGIDINYPIIKGYTPLSIASQCGHLEIVQTLLLKDGIDINRPCDQGATPLFMASQCGHLEIVQALLLKEGIEINRPDDKGATPLYPINLKML
jgi:ankyrin repeat protein